MFKIKNVLILVSKVAVFLLIILNILGKTFYETSKTVWTTSFTKSYISFIFAFVVKKQVLYDRAHAHLIDPHNFYSPRAHVTFSLCSEAQGLTITYATSTIHKLLTKGFYDCIESLKLFRESVFCSRS